MIAKHLVDRFIQALIVGAPLPLPENLWLAATSPQGERLARVPLQRSDWQWTGDVAVYRAELAFEPLSGDSHVVTGLALYDAATSGSEVATFPMEAERLNRRGILEIPAGALVIRGPK